MLEPISLSAITTLALSGIGWLAAASIAGTVGNLTDRTFQSVVRGVRDRLAGLRDAPDGLTIAHAVRVAEIQALEHVVRDYGTSLRRPKLFRPSNTKQFIARSLAYCASSIGRSVDFRMTPDVDAHTPLIAAASEALALPVTDAPAQDRANRLSTVAEDAVLAEILNAVKPLALPPGFEMHFRLGERGYSSFSTLFGFYLQKQLETNEAFRHVYSTALLAQVEQLAARTHDAVERIETSVDHLRADMRAGIADSEEHLPPGSTLNFATTDTYFGRRLSSDTTFNHARPLVGRDDLMHRMVAEILELLGTPGAGVVAISAIGGAGKSRFLIEVAHRLEPRTNVLWVRDGVDVTLNALSQLPPGPLLLICEDAQRRSDLTTLFRLAESRRDNTVVLVSTRPYGKDALQTSLFGASIAYDQRRDFGELPDVPADDLVPLLEEELGASYRHLGRDLLRLAGDSILVALMAARLLRTRQLDPAGILLDPEFRATVLDGFREEAMGMLPGSLDTAASKTTLETLAAVQPVRFDDEVFEGAFAAYIGVDVSVLRRTLDAFIEGGVVRADRSGFRIVPDILGDHVLNRAMVTRDRPTALDTEILDALGADILVNLVRNVAELDWQRSAAKQPGLVFVSAWQSFTVAFMAAPNATRKDWLEHLHPVAAFQPAPMLELARTLLYDPTGDDRASGYFDIRTSDTEVIRALPPLLAIVAQHPEHTVDALDLLWTIGRADDRATNAHPDHAMRRIAELVAYSRRRHIWMQERALDALERWLTDPNWSTAPHSPLLVVNAVLQTSMTEHSFNERDSSVTMTRIGVHAGNTRAVRLRGIALLERLVTQADAMGRHRALTELLNALHRPDGAFGHEVSVAEEESFRDQYTAALDAIERIVAKGTDPLALVTIRTDLNSSARFTLLAWKAERMRRIAETVENSPGTRLVRALAFTHRDWEPERESHEEHARRWTENTRIAVDETVEQAGTPEAIAQHLSDTCDLYKSAQTAYDPGLFLQTLVERHPEVGYGLAVWSIDSAERESTERPEWLPPLLAALRTVQPVQYEELLHRAAGSDPAKVRQAAAAAMYRVRGENRRSDLEIDLTRTLMQDSDIEVIRTALACFGFMDLEQVSPLLPLVALRGDVRAAEELAGAWAMWSGEQVPEPDEDTTRHLLRQLVEVPHFRQAEWEVSQMLAALARRHPEAVVDFLTSRVERERASWGASKVFDFDTRYDAIPSQGFDGLQEALRDSDRYEAVVEQLLSSLTVLIDGTRVMNEVAHTVLGTLGQWDEVLEGIVRRWIVRADCENLASSSALFEELPRDFVLTSRRLVVDLLDAVEKCDPETRHSVEQSLELGTFQNDYLVLSVGEPHPMTLRIASEAETAASELSRDGHVSAATFYARLAARARETLEWERRRDEEASHKR